MTRDKLQIPNSKLQTKTRHQIPNTAGVTLGPSEFAILGLSSDPVNQPRRLAQQRVRSRQPVIVVAGCLPLSAAEKLGGPVPGYDPLVQQTPGSGQQGLLRSRNLPGRSVRPEREAPNAGEEDSRVQFQRSLAETPPVYHSGAVTQFEDMVGVKPAVQEVRAALHRPRPRQLLN